MSKLVIRSLAKLKVSSQWACVKCLADTEIVAFGIVSHYKHEASAWKTWSSCKCDRYPLTTTSNSPLYWQCVHRIGSVAKTYCAEPKDMGSIPGIVAAFQMAVNSKNNRVLRFRCSLKMPRGSVFFRSPPLRHTSYPRFSFVALNPTLNQSWQGATFS